MSISRRLILSTTVAIFALACILGIYIVNNYASARRETQAYIKSQQETMLSVLNTKGQTVKNASVSFSQFTYVEEYFTSSSIGDKIANSRIINNFAQYVIETNPDIIGISLINSDNLPLTVGPNLDSVVLKTVQQIRPEVFGEGINEAFEAFFTPLLNTPRRSGDYFAFVMPVYATNNPVPMTRIGTCITLCDARGLQNVMEQSTTPVIVDVRLYDAQSGLMASRRDVRLHDKRIDVYDEWVPSTGWKLQLDVDFSRNQAGQLSVQTMLLIVGLCCMLILFVSLTLHINLVRPVQSLAKSLDEMTENTVIEQRFNNELDVIVETIQGMVHRLAESARTRLANETKMYELQLHAKQTEVSALQSQINPHFLYNTLECMRSIGLFYEAQEIVDISSAMSSIFRYSIKGENYVQLAQELEIVKQYLMIIDIRFDGRFDVQIDFTPETLSCCVPKMILQPIVENAIYHGLEPVRGRGKLKLVGRLHEGIMYLIVEDNGRGMDEEELAALQAQLAQGLDLSHVGGNKNIGLANIHQRIKLMAPNGGLEVTAHKDKGTTVCLRLPIAHSEPGTQ